MPARIPKGRKWRIGACALAGIAAASLLAACSSSPTAHSAQLIDNAAVTTLSMTSPTPYTPHPQNGGTDDYHCTLLNPHVQRNSFIVASQFIPGKGPSTVEVHHAILFLGSACTG